MPRRWNCASDCKNCWTASGFCLKAKSTYLDTPRRLAVLAPNVSAAQPDVTEQVPGPSVSVAFKNGEATPAAHAFARKAGVEISQLERVNTPKGEYLSAKITKKGRAAAEILAELLPKEIASIYWPKNMYWRKPSERFVRPVRWLVAMLDEEIIPLEFDGVLPATSRADTGFWPTGRLRFRAPERLTWRPC